MAKKRISGGEQDNQDVDYIAPANPAVRIDPDVKELLARCAAAIGKSEKDVADLAIREYCERHSAAIVSKLKELIEQLSAKKPR
jgi:hypothetical protein